MPSRTSVCLGALAAGVPLPGVAVQGGEGMLGSRLDAGQDKRVIAGDREHVVRAPVLAAPA
jgi:hypothetical protein